MLEKPAPIVLEAGKQRKTHSIVLAIFEHTTSESVTLILIQCSLFHLGTCTLMYHSGMKGL